MSCSLSLGLADWIQRPAYQQTAIDDVGFLGKPSGVKVSSGLGRCPGSGLDGSLLAAASQQ